MNSHLSLLQGRSVTPTHPHELTSFSAAEVSYTHTSAWTHTFLCCRGQLHPHIHMNSHLSLLQGRSVTSTQTHTFLCCRGQLHPHKLTPFSAAEVSYIHMNSHLSHIHTRSVISAYPHAPTPFFCKEGQLHPHIHMNSYLSPLQRSACSYIHIHHELLPFPDLKPPLNECMWSNSATEKVSVQLHSHPSWTFTFPWSETST